MLEAPQRNRDKADHRDPPLLLRECLARRADGTDLDVALAVRRARGVVRDQQQQPDEHDGDARDG